MEPMDLELQKVESLPENNNDATDRPYEVSATNGSCSNMPRAVEGSPLLPSEQAAEINPEMIQRDASQEPHHKKRLLDNFKTKMNKPVWKLKVWMILVGILAVIILIILISVLACSVPRKDMDEEYNTEEFVLSRSFRGNFSLILDPQLQSADHLNHQLQEKLTHIYRSSHALERYFSMATIRLLRRSNNTVVEYELKFVMPEEHEQLIHYTLSKEMVYHVLLQNLYDQETKDPVYIEPYSLSMYNSAS